MNLVSHLTCPSSKFKLKRSFQAISVRIVAETCPILADSKTGCSVRGSVLQRGQVACQESHMSIQSNENYVRNWAESGRVHFPETRTDKLRTVTH